MSAPLIRRTNAEDLAAIIALNDAAFGGPDEGRITQALQADGDSLLSLVAEVGGVLSGHIEFFRILVDGAPVAVGLGPMSARPGLQKTGIGSRLVQEGLGQLQQAGETLVFVLGHDTYYPRFGFSEAAAGPFTAPWSGPHFMALQIAEIAPSGGKLTYPPAFGG